MVCENAEAVADLEAFKNSAFARLDFAVLLRQAGDAHVGLVSVNIQTYKSISPVKPFSVISWFIFLLVSHACLNPGVFLAGWY